MNDAWIDYSDIPPLDKFFLHQGDGSMAAGQATTHHPPRRGRAEVVEGPRQRLPDAHQSYSAGGHGRSAAAPVAIHGSAEEEHRVARRIEAGQDIP